MDHKPQISFGSFRLDTVNETLWQGEQKVSLRPKPLAVLRYLAEHPGRLVTREELMKAVWANTYVSSTVLRVALREIREALGEDATAPQFIETAPRRGYRFIATITAATQSVQGLESGVQSLKSVTSVVGRKAELAQLQSWLAKALQGERQIGFITGEPGIGKTTVVEAFIEQAFVEQAAVREELWIGWGQCVEQYGAGEAYLPVLEALGRLCREAEGQTLIELLAQYAPTWLVQMPSLLKAAELEALQPRVIGATRERMLREMAEAVKALTDQRPLVLVLEDLHWSDYSTLELLSTLARRRERARLLIIGTYRLAEVIVREHPLREVKQELQLHRQCEELVLEYLSEGAVEEYLSTRFAGGRFAAGLARSIHQRTGGNPLFMVNVVNYLLAQGAITEVDGGWELRGGLEEVEVGVPESLRQMIEKQIERLGPEERQVLEVASVAGVDFSAATVAAGMEGELVEVEERCEKLVRSNQFLRSRGIEEWPDGTVASRYSFIHALYQEVLYGRVAGARRVQLHRKVGEREEVGYGELTGEIAAELAVHFERGREYGRAVGYLGQAGENAIRRSAHQEAIDLLTKGLELLKSLPDTAEHTQQELMLQIALGAALIAAKGYGAPEVGKTYTQARELCQQVGETPQLVRVLFGLWSFYVTQGQHQMARSLGEQLLNLGQRIQNPPLRMAAYHAPGETAFWLGEFPRAHEYFEQGIARYDPRKHRPYIFSPGMDPWGVSLSYAAFISFSAFALWYLGYPDQAQKRMRESITQARELAHSFSLAYAFVLAGWFYQFRRERQAVQEQAEAAITLATKQGFPELLAWATIQQGWALAEQGQAEEGITQIRQGLDVVQNIGSKVMLPYLFALLAEAYGKAGQAKEGLTVLTEALAIAQSTAERHYEAELYRLRGELLLAQEGKKQKAEGTSERVAEAETCFSQAIDIARHQSAKSLELRAVVSLSRLWQRQGKKKQARQILAEIYGWFTEGFETVDLKEAKALLKDLGAKGIS